MELKPIKKYNMPKYPEKCIVNKDPSVLKSIPQRWKNNASHGLLLSGLIGILLSGCSTDRGHVDGGVAPVMNLLTEDEAWQVIVEEAKKEGINFEVTGKEIKNVDLLFSGCCDKNGIRTKDSNASITFRLDGLDEDKKIGFEFITSDDFFEWTDCAKEQGKLEYCVFNEEVAANNLREAANKNDEGIIVGTFYNRTFTTTVEDSKEMLKVQVKEFIEWLKAEKII